MKALINTLRLLVVGNIFGLVYALSPKVVIGFFFGIFFMSIALKIEALEQNIIKGEE